MTQTKLLIGSLSNDLYRVANLVQRGSYEAADEFFDEAKKWARDLSKFELKDYIKEIVEDLKLEKDIRSTKTAEKLLMYSILLQNYSLHIN